jgi:hypothetical protein
VKKPAKPVVVKFEEEEDDDMIGKLLATN